MKKVITLIFVALLVLSALAACNSHSDGDTAVSSDVEIQQELSVIGDWIASVDRYPRDDGTSSDMIDTYQLTIDDGSSITMVHTAYTDEVKNILSGSYQKNSDNELSISFNKVETYTRDYGSDEWKLSSDTLSFPTRDLTAEEGAASAILDGNTLKLFYGEEEEIAFTRNY